MEGTLLRYLQNVFMIHSMLRQDMNKKSKIREMILNLINNIFQIQKDVISLIFYSQHARIFANFGNQSLELLNYQNIKLLL